MSPLLLVLLIVLIVLAVGGAPAWGFHDLGWFPSGGIGLVILILIILLLLGKL